MTVAVLIPTVRPSMLNDLLASWKYGNTEGMQLHIIAQREEQQEFLRVLIKYPELRTLIHYQYRENGSPLWPVRAGYLRDHAEEADNWVVIDDDLILLEGKTDWRAAIEYSNQKHVGVISCNWARSEAFIDKKWPPPEKPEKRWLKEHVINIGGGLVMRQEIAKLIGTYRTDVPWMFDGTMYGLVPYLNGYQNYRDLGSLVIHKILAAGGMKEVRKKFPLVPLPEDMITCPPSSEIYKGELAVNNVNIPTATNLTPKARAIHKQMKIEKGFA